MRRHPSFGTALLAAAAALSLAVPSARAQDGMVTRGYVFTPKPGMEAAFAAAFRAHLEWRKANHDPWSWSVYTPVTGELGTYIVRSGRHTWAELDSYEQGFGPKGGDRFNADVGPYVAGTRSVIDMSLPDSLNKRPPDGTQIQLVTVTTFLVRPGMQPQFMQLIGQASKALKAANWPPSWSWFVPQSGAEDMGPVVYLASPVANWAGMKEPNPPFDAVLAKALGKDGFAKWGETFNQTIRGVNAATYRYHPDLSIAAP